MTPLELACLNSEMVVQIGLPSGKISHNAYSPCGLVFSYPQSPLFSPLLAQAATNQTQFEIVYHLFYIHLLACTFFFVYII